MKEDFKNLITEENLIQINTINNSSILNDDTISKMDQNTPKSTVKTLKMSKISSSLSTLVDSVDAYEFLARSEDANMKSIYDVDYKIVSKNINLIKKFDDQDEVKSSGKFKSETNIIPRNIRFGNLERTGSHELDFTDKEYSELICKKIINCPKLDFNFKSLLTSNTCSTDQKIYNINNNIFNGNNSNLIDKNLNENNLSLSKFKSEEVFTKPKLIKEFITSHKETLMYDSKRRNFDDEKYSLDDDFFEEDDSDDDSSECNEKEYNNEDKKRNFSFTITYYVPNVVNESLAKKSKSHVLGNHLNLNQNYLISNFHKEKIELEMKHTDKVKDLIFEIIKNMNSNKKNKVKFNPNLKYTLRQSKKSGYPNFDMPCKTFIINRFKSRSIHSRHIQ